MPLTLILIGVGKHVAEIIAAHQIENKVVSKTWRFFHPNKYKNQLVKVINETIEEFEKTHPYNESKGKFPFYHSKKIFEHLSLFVLFKKGNIETIKSDFFQSTNIIPPIQSDIDDFYSLFLNKVNSDLVLKSRFIYENYKEQIFQISTTIDSIKQTVDSIENILIKKDDDLILPYQVAFQKQLDKTNPNLTFQFHNQFFGRDMDLIMLDDFIKKSSETAIAVVAEGGYGKTRFCIEYFKNYIDNDSNYYTYVLKEGVSYLPDFTKQVESNKKIIILIDDAHRKRSILNNIIIDAIRFNNIKLILTVRKNLYKETLADISSHNRGEIKYLELERLTYEETASLFKSQLPHFHSQDIYKLSDESKGIPIVILGLCQMAFNGKYSSGLSEEGNFIHFVVGIKKQAIDDVYNRFFIDKNKVQKTIELLSAFSPVKNSENEIKAISSINEISFEETNQIIDYLSQLEFLSKRNEISIMPDPYRDIIFIDTIPRIKILLKRTDLNLFIDRLIKNIVEVEDSERVDINVDSVVLDFVLSFSNINSISDENKLNQNLTTLASFAYKKPKFAIKALELIFNSFKDNNNFWATSKNEYSHYTLREIHQKIDIIFSITMLNTHLISDLESNFLLILNYIKLRNDFTLLNKSFCYRVYDFYEFKYAPRLPCERQSFLIGKIEKINSGATTSNFDKQIVLTSAKLLLELDINLESYFNKYTGAYSFGNTVVPYNSVTAKIRIRAVEVLIKLFFNNRHSDFSKKAYHEILRILFFVATPRNNEYQFNQEEEIKIVNDFFKNLLKGDISMEERSQLLYQLKLFENREIKETYKELTFELIELTQNINAVKDKLNLFLLNYHRLDDENTEIELSSIIGNYSDWKQFYSDVNSIMENAGIDKQHNIIPLADLLVKKYPTNAKELFDFILQNNIDYLPVFGTLVRAFYKDEEYYYNSVNIIWDSNRKELKELVIWLLTYGRNRDIAYYRKTDLNYFEALIIEGDKQSIWQLSDPIVKYIVIDLDRTLKLITNIMKFYRANPHNIDSMIHTLYTDEDLTTKYPIQLKNFAFSEVTQAEINQFPFGYILSFLDSKFGFDTLLEFLIQKINFFKSKKESSILSLDNLFYHNTKTTELKEKDFIKVLEWYSGLVSKSEYVEIKIVELIRPGIAISQSLKEKILILVKNHIKNISELINIGNALSVFENKNEDLFSILIYIANSVVDLGGIDVEILINIFGHSIVYNSGVKSKSGKGAFPQDIIRRDLLMLVLGKYEMRIQVKAVLETALSNVNRDIQRDENEDTLEQW